MFHPAFWCFLGTRCARTVFLSRPTSSTTFAALGRVIAGWAHFLSRTKTVWQHGIVKNAWFKDVQRCRAPNLDSVEDQQNVAEWSRMINSPIFSRRGAQQAVFSCLFFVWQDWSRIRFPWRLHLSAEGWELLVNASAAEWAMGQKWSKCLPTLGSFRAISMRLVDSTNHSNQLRWDSLPSSYTVKRRWGDIQKQLGFQQFSVVSKSQNWFWTSFMS